MKHVIRPQSIYLELFMFQRYNHRDRPSQTKAWNPYPKAYSSPDTEFIGISKLLSQVEDMRSNWLFGEKTTPERRVRRESDPMQGEEWSEKVLRKPTWTSKLYGRTVNWTG